MSTDCHMSDDDACWKRLRGPECGNNLLGPHFLQCLAERILALRNELAPYVVAYMAHEQKGHSGHMLTYSTQTMFSH